ncbi:hypothetical protein IL252_07385 [Halomicrobium sp. IBSBa]|uniref:hypothetical protein n=1 Tax=Halomicrobium sp. IBSBa TaxID=2778916 RepID=UPI001ABF99F3|nr:hypothetical protein [Halomicrobium sp. IBSBa]MBO4247637.1 hypothetical protein [Halomicrobium sp. IBSBa]
MVDETVAKIIAFEIFLLHLSIVGIYTQNNIEPYSQLVIFPLAASGLLSTIAMVVGLRGQ